MAKEIKSNNTIIKLKYSAVIVDGQFIFRYIKCPVFNQVSICNVQFEPFKCENCLFFADDEKDKGEIHCKFTDEVKERLFK